MNDFIYNFGGALLRVLFVVSGAALGYFIGWLGSPQVERFWRIAWIVIAILLALAAIFLDGVIGWNIAFLLATIGFAAGLAYWYSEKITGFFERPTTHDARLQSLGNHR